MISGPSTSLHDRLQDSYHTLLLEYAAGLLDQAQSLIVASHLALSPAGRQLVRRCEALGGAILEHNCTPASMRAESLNRVLEQIDKPREAPQDPCDEICDILQGCAVPPLLKTIILHQKKTPKWSAVLPGAQTFRLEMECKSSAVRFWNLRPACKTPHHSHKGTEITLVLGGAFSDEGGAYKAGDLIVTDDEIDHTPVACPDQGCVCMVVSAAPIRLRGLAALLNPLLRR